MGLRKTQLMIKVLFITLIVAAVYAIANVAGAPHSELYPFATAVVGTPTGLSGMNATALRRIAFDKKLREDSILPSVFSALETALKVVGDQIVVEKAGILMKISPEKAGGGQSVRLALAKPFRKAPQYGTSKPMLTNEDERDLLWTELYYNEVKKSIKYYKYGFFHNDTQYLGWVESQGPALTTYMQELRDLRMHQALLLGRSEELTEDPLGLSQPLNPNWVIPNLDDSRNPAWDLTAMTVTDGDADDDGYYSSRSYSGATAFAENIAARMLEGSGVGSTGLALLTVDTFYYIRDYVVNVLRVEPLWLDGKPTYVLLVPSRVYTWCMNPNNAGSLGEAFQKYECYKSSERIQLPYEFGRICGNMILCENHRAPTITVGGEAGTYSLNFGFCCPGDNDDRNMGNWSNTSGSTNYVFDCVIGLGANAVAEYLHDPLNTKLFEQTEYGKIEGRGAYLGEGLQLPMWDKDAAGRVDGVNRTLVYRGSFIVPISRTARSKVV